MQRVCLNFHGSAGTVTGSCFEVIGQSKRILIDCGMFQGTRSLEHLNYEPLPFDPTAIDAVILTHAHLDHSGRLPYLVASGCDASIWCTAPTADIVEPLLLDSAKLQAADVARRNRRPDRARQPKIKPLYDEQDVDNCIARLRVADYCEWTDLGDGCGFRFWDARHIVGSASVELLIDGQRLLFSGDIGNGRIIPCSGAESDGFDHVICEATYGDRNRDPVLISDRREYLAAHVDATLARGGNLLIPAFAVERTQVVLEDFMALFASKRLKPIYVFVDSPLADKVTRATLRHRFLGADPFDFPNIRFVHDVTESKRLNSAKGAVIIAGSGMCTGGRIRHHLVQNLPLPQSRVLLVGYQANGTLGAVLRAGAQHVRISGYNVPVAAQIFSTDSYSTHADQAALLEWLEARSPITGTLFTVHGERLALEELKTKAGSLAGITNIVTPAIGEQWRLAPSAPARRSIKAKPETLASLAPKDWTGQLAAFKAGLDDRIAQLPNAKSREKALLAISQQLERAERLFA